MKKENICAPALAFVCILAAKVRVYSRDLCSAKNYDVDRLRAPIQIQPILALEK
jgi:hypothetical protein